MKVTKIENRYLQEESIACFTKKYKPVLETLSSQFRILRNIQENSLKKILELLE